MNIHHSRIRDDPPARNRSRISVGGPPKDVGVVESLPEQREGRVEPQRGNDQEHSRDDLDIHRGLLRRWDADRTITSSISGCGFAPSASPPSAAVRSGSRRPQPLMPRRRGTALS